MFNKIYKLAKKFLPYSSDSSSLEVFFGLSQDKIASISKISALSRNIEGMIGDRAGEELFSLCYMQELVGDVVEIGSWQGKSTFFLGTAVKLSKNGRMYAIDHFKGNSGKERFYKVNKDDLSDIEDIFIKNMSWAGLGKTVQLINKPSKLAAKQLKDRSVRLLFIDGDHTRNGVQTDLNLFRKKLKSRAIVVFDDFDEHSFPELVEVAKKFITTNKSVRSYSLGRTLVVRIP